MPVPPRRGFSRLGLSHTQRQTYIYRFCAWTGIHLDTHIYMCIYRHVSLYTCVYTDTILFLQPELFFNILIFSHMDIIVFNNCIILHYTTRGAVFNTVTLLKYHFLQKAFTASPSSDLKSFFCAPSSQSTGKDWLFTNCLLSWYASSMRARDHISQLSLI